MIESSCIALGSGFHAYSVPTADGKVALVVETCGCPVAERREALRIVMSPGEAKQLGWNLEETATFHVPKKSRAQKAAV